MRMEIVTKVLVAALCVAGASATAYAGLKFNIPVTLVNSQGSGQAGAAYGSLGTARNSGDGTQWIGCEISGYPGAPVVGVLCGAQDASGAVAYCYASDPTMVAAAATVTSDSFLRFDWNAGGTCTYIQVRNQSPYAPKAP